MKRLRMKLMNLSKKPLMGKRRQRKLLRDEVKLVRNLKKYAGKKAAETKIPKQEKRPQESDCKTQSTEEKTNCDPKAPKMATWSSSRLKPVPEKLRN